MVKCRLVNEMTELPTLRWWESTESWPRLLPGADDGRWPCGAGDVPEALVRNVAAGRGGQLAHRPAVTRVDDRGRRLVRTVCGQRLRDALEADHLVDLRQEVAGIELCERCWPAYRIPGSRRSMGHGFYASDDEIGEDGGYFTFTGFDLVTAVRVRWRCRWTGASLLGQPRAWVSSVDVLEVSVAGGGEPGDLREALSVASTSGAHRVVARLASRGRAPVGSPVISDLLGVDRVQPEVSAAERRRAMLEGVARVADATPWGQRREAVQRWLRDEYGPTYSNQYVRQLISEAGKAGLTAEPLRPGGRRSGSATRG